MSEATASLDWRVGLEEVLLGDSPPPDWILKLCDSIASGWTSFILRDKVLSESSCRCLAQALSTSNRITYAIFRNAVGPRCMVALTDQLLRAYSDDKHPFAVSTLQHLHLHYNQLGDEGAEVLARLLSSGILPHLTYLQVSDTDMRQPGLTAVIRALPRMAEAQLATKHEPDATFRFALNASCNQLFESRSLTATKSVESQGPPSSCFYELGRSTAQGFLTAIDLNSNRLNADVIRDLVEGMLSVSSETQPISIHADAPSQAASMASNLIILGLGYNRLGNSGAKAVARMLRHYETACPVLSFLAVYNCEIGNEGAISVACALAAPNVKLKDIEVDENMIDEDGMAAFIQTLQSKNRTLTKCLIDRRTEQPQQELIDHYCELNKRDRSKWGDVKLNAALWPYVLSRTGTGILTTLDCVFAALRDRPDFLMNQPSEATSRSRRKDV